MDANTRHREIAKRFVERAGALNMKGAARDRAALDYFTGAAAGAELAGDAALAQSIGMVAALIVSVRGFFGVKELAEKDA